MFVTSFAFCVITFEPIECQTCSAHQNDRQNLIFVKDIKVVVEKMTRNRYKGSENWGTLYFVVCTAFSFRL